ncbi:type VII secretion-associated protein [Skermania sp. ID1734]|uniref:type VII secretion-associated protein n=1 Tax=Skermania sp. ID1734 TaxID=2597516 RepID=UPI0011802687|nr:type VII secretion-associated protein [Skermania sp. ID1734]TSE02107.1 type VII secretion-associated protein [Skermania sp. ID1734]
MTTPVLIHLTSEWLWVRHGQAQWSGPAVVAHDGSGLLFADAAVGSQYDLVRVCDGVDPGVLTVAGDSVTFAAALSGLVSYALDGVGLAGNRPESLRLSHPSHWGTPRRRALETPLRQLADDVTTIPVASAVARANPAGPWRAHHARMVVELNTFGLTMTVVVDDPGGPQLRSCAFEPTITGAEIDEDAVRAATQGLLDDGRVREILVTSGSDLSLSALRASIVASGIVGDRVVAVSGAEVATGLEPPAQPAAIPAVSRLPAAGWLEQAVTLTFTDKRDSRRKVLAIAGCLSAALVVGLIVLLGVRSRATDSATAIADAQPTAVTTRPPEVSAPPTPARVTETIAAAVNFARVRFDPPIGWSVRGAATDSRLELRPDDGSRRRIVLTQTSLAPDAGMEEVYRLLAMQITTRAPRFDNLENGVVFAERPTVAYHERAEDDSQVNWYVLVDHDLQVSVGCQFVEDGWAAVSDACAQVTRSVRIGPA